LQRTQDTLHIVYYPTDATSAEPPSPWQYIFPGNVRFHFNGWSVSGGTSSAGNTPAGFSVVVTADASLTAIIGNVSPEYLVVIKLENTINVGCTTLPNPLQPIPGVVLIDNVCYNTSASVWLPE